MSPFKFFVALLRYSYIRFVIINLEKEVLRWKKYMI
jgi:hypothetical protein